MRPTIILPALRAQVAERASLRCEYCLLAGDDSFEPHEADHIRPRKHKGQTTLDNLAYACLRCNRAKGSDVASYDPETGELTPLFNPRTQVWHEHFALKESLILPLTAVGRVTVEILQLNSPERVLERQLLMELKRYP